MGQEEGFGARLEKVEAQLAIQQLPIRYALAADSRDLDGMVSLFVPDVEVGRRGTGRPALRDFYDKIFRAYYRSQRLICGHAIDLVDADNATGTVYCRGEHEVGDKWITMAICYFDSYRRVDGAWLFVRRSEKHWYAADVVERPQDVQFNGWGQFTSDKHRAHLPHDFPTWETFWDTARDERATLTRHP